MNRYVGIGTPLALGATLAPPLELPKLPDAELLAPGNGVTKISPLVVRMIVPKLATTGSVRSSSTQSHRSGRNTSRVFIKSGQPAWSGGVNRAWTDQSVHSAYYAVRVWVSRVLGVSLAEMFRERLVLGS